MASTLPFALHTVHSPGNLAGLLVTPADGCEIGLVVHETTVKCWFLVWVRWLDVNLRLWVRLLGLQINDCSLRFHDWRGIPEKRCQQLMPGEIFKYAYEVLEPEVMWIDEMICKCVWAYMVIYLPGGRREWSAYAGMGYWAFINLWEVQFYPQRRWNQT